jgi:anti-sigma-K factor RskA
MKSKTEQEELMARYLLGRLPADERACVEEKFLSDKNYFEQLLAVEDAIMDEYVCGELSEDDRQQFEKFLLASDDQRQNLEFTRELIASITEAKEAEAEDPHYKEWEKQSRTNLFPLPSLKVVWLRNAIALVLLAGAGALLLMRVAQQKSPMVETVAESPAQGTSKLSEGRVEEDNSNNRVATGNIRPGLTPAEHAPQAPRSTVASITLLPESVLRSGGETRTVRLGAGVQRLIIHIRLKRKEDYEGYHAEIRTLEGRRVWNGGVKASFRQGSKTVSLDLPATLFAEGDYVISLSGEALGGERLEIGDYPFSARR